MNKEKFQKNIFQVWFQGYENIENRTYLENIKNWKKLNPAWNYFLLDDKDLEENCSEFSERCLNAYRNAKYMHSKIDLGKVVTLYLRGGIMIDMDMYILRSLDYSNHVNKIIHEYNSNKKDIMAISEIPITEIESIVKFGKKKAYNNAVIISSPNNELLKKYIYRMIYNIEKCKTPKNKFNYINITTGPDVFNKYIYNKVNTNRIIELPSEVFEPYNIMSDNIKITDDTISIHIFNQSWTPNYIKFLVNLYKKKHTVLTMILVCVILFYFLKKK